MALLRREFDVPRKTGYKIGDWREVADPIASCAGANVRNERVWAYVAIRSVKPSGETTGRSAIRAANHGGHE